MPDTVVSLSHRELLKADKDHEKAASIVNLVYVRDDMPGISRVKKGKVFSYLFNNKPVTDPKQIGRINRLVIPPAWTNVWICVLENGHIQATGLDARHRKQYRYHALWNLLRNETKFHRMYEFGKALPQLRMKIEQDMARRELTQEKVIATVISLMERTYIRIGSNSYEKMNGSYGLTTLKDKHVSISGDTIMFSFKGKKGIPQRISLRNKRLARTIKQCRDIPGKELFQYYDAEGNHKTIESGMVNDYIKSAMGADFTAKDFRTWAGSIHALEALRSLEEATTAGQRKKNIVAVLDMVSSKLGNTRAVCKKYYVHPMLFRLYEENNLTKYTAALDKIEKQDEKTGLTAGEQVLLKILEANKQLAISNG